MSDSNTDSIYRAFRYRETTTARQAAWNQYNYAGTALRVADIEMRAAELGSQSLESVDGGKLHATLMAISYREREVALAFVRYAVYGRSDKP